MPLSLSIPNRGPGLATIILDLRQRSECVMRADHSVSLSDQYCRTLSNPRLLGQIFGVTSTETVTLP